MPAEFAPEPSIGALSAIIREQSAPERMRRDLERYLREHGVDGEDLGAMLEVGAERMLVYRGLVHNRLRHTVRDFIARTAARLGKDALKSVVAAFIEERAAKSYYLRDVPAEFVAWVVPRWREDPGVPSYLADLARHELLEFDVRNDPRGGEEPTGQAVALDRPLRFDGAARRVDYDYAVHRLETKLEDRTVPEHVPTALLVYRDPDNRVRYLELIPFAAALLDRLLVAGQALQPAIVGACEAIGEPLDDDKLGQAAVLLADLADRHVMLGAQ